MNTSEYNTGGGLYLKPKETEPFDTVINDVLSETDFNNKACLTLEVPDQSGEVCKLQLKWYQVKELEDLFSKETDDWKGQAIHVGLTSIKVQDTDYDVFKYTAGKAVKLSKPVKSSAPSKAADPPLADIKGDDLPF